MIIKSLFELIQLASGNWLRGSENEPVNILFIRLVCVGALVVVGSSLSWEDVGRIE